MKVLVTGGAGFTGVHLVRALLDRGDDVTVLDLSEGDSLDTEPLKARGAKFIIGSVADKAALRNAVRGQEVIFHLASAFRDIHRGAPLFQEVDVEGTRRLLQEARLAGTRRVVHCSTQGVHGSLPAGTVPGNEESPIAPIDYYCEAKVAAEAVCDEFIADGMDIVNVRPTSIYGPGDTHGWLKLFRICSKGRFLMLGSGNVFNHPVYVGNLVDGFLLAADVPEARGRTYLVGDGEYVSLNELVKLIGKVLGTRVKLYRFPWQKPVHGLAYLMEVASRPFDYEPPLFRRRLTWFSTNRGWEITRARTELGFRPRISLEQGLALTKNWYYERGLLSLAFLSTFPLAP